MESMAVKIDMGQAYDLVELMTISKGDNVAKGEGHTALLNKAEEDGLIHGVAWLLLYYVWPRRGHHQDGEYDLQNCAFQHIKRESNHIGHQLANECLSLSEFPQPGFTNINKEREGRRPGKVPATEDFPPADTTDIDTDQREGPRPEEVIISLQAPSR
ncbi:uncharacterized protein A4U43_C02F9350 [Asparagus officinalis]|uniref:Uncharacterized protein n=1 Tax=Asparagus officinalis TaxID=4686 RepID=A0A5P1FH84_ASPOF|nr:uncharacterized protein A4U43_C02F9350 [Asparagus officinalis]